MRVDQAFEEARSSLAFAAPGADVGALHDSPSGRLAAGRARADYIAIPPLTSSTCPVTKLAAGEAR